MASPAALGHLGPLARSRRGRLALTVGSGALAIGLSVLAVRHFAVTGWPLSRGRPVLLAAAGILLLVAYAFKAYGWRRLFAADERPQPLALAAANGGASVTGVALPGRFDDLVRIAIVRRYPQCPAGVRSLCLSLFMLGLIDSIALAPLAVAAAVLPGHAVSLRAGLALIAGAGIGAAALVITLPRIVASRRLLRFRLARWLSPRTTSMRGASQSWALVSASWLLRAVALFLLLGAFGIGLSFPLALLVLCAGRGGVRAADRSGGGGGPGRRGRRRACRLRRRGLAGSRFRSRRPGDGRAVRGRDPPLRRCLARRPPSCADPDWRLLDVCPNGWQRSSLHVGEPEPAWFHPLLRREL